MYPVKYGMDVSVDLVRSDDRVEVVVHAPMYMNKTWKMPHCYATTFSDAAILNDSDFIRVMLSHYPKDPT